MPSFLSLGSVLVAAFAGLSQATTLTLDCECCFDYQTGGNPVSYLPYCNSAGPIDIGTGDGSATLLSFWGCFDPSDTTDSLVVPGCGEQLSIDASLTDVYYRVTDDGNCVYDANNNLIGCGEAEIVYQGGNQTQPNPYGPNGY